MPSISDLRACKNCMNVFTEKISGVRTSPAKCPVCESTRSEDVYHDH